MATKQATIEGAKQQELAAAGAVGYTMGDALLFVLLMGGIIFLLVVWAAGVPLGLGARLIAGLMG